MEIMKKIVYIPTWPINIMFTCSRVSSTSDLTFGFVTTASSSSSSSSSSSPSFSSLTVSLANFASASSFSFASFSSKVSSSGVSSGVSVTGSEVVISSCGTTGYNRILIKEYLKCDQKN